MSTHRRIELAAVIVIVLALVGAVCAYVAGSSRQESSAGHEMAYTQTLFDTSRVHTIDIVMDDWDGFIEGCEDEEYASCAVVIDGESFKNVAIRAKGNTSLSSVKNMDSDRYSFKIEFDHYEQATKYHGLDKLSLNNIIQDNTYMKDYLTYLLMGSFGVDSPLASYVFITVNGQDWGLYLAVEGVEDSFLERNYGTDIGELYKPDSMGMGGGRGNGREFNMTEALDQLEDTSDADSESDAKAGSDSDAKADAKADAKTDAKTDAASGETKPAEASGEKADDNSGERPQMPGGFGGQGGGGGPSMGASDVRLQYVDDDPNSYSNIFENAKTNVTYADKARLIESLRKLGEGEDLESVLDMDEVLRYFVVHDFVCNGDSYTGTMVHNYYLHESDGKLSMIPWDYNLAFGGFNGGDATTLVNSPIDDPTASSFGGFGGGKGMPGAGDDAEPVSEDDAEGSTENEDSQAPQMPEGMQQPPNFGGGQMPEGMSQPPNFNGGQMPEGMPQMPNGGGQMPDGMPQMPNADGEQMPEGAQNDEGSQRSDDQSSRQQPDFSALFGASEGSDSRPMVDWIFADEAYTTQYHELYQEFLDTYDLAAIIDETEAMIADYVDRDPTKFCTTEEFEAGVSALRGFCTLRAQSVQGQLDGTIPSTEEGQSEDSSSFVDASSVTISDMGSMGSGGGGRPGEDRRNADATDGDGKDANAEGGNGKDTNAEGGNGQNANDGGGNGPGGNGPGGNGGSGPAGGPPNAGDFDPRTASQQTQAPDAQTLVTLGACAALLALGFGATRLYRKT